jgi:hypothetical protein
VLKTRELVLGRVSSLSLVACAGGLVFLAAGAADATPRSSVERRVARHDGRARVASPAARFYLLRVCTQKSFDRDQVVCRTDQRGQSLVASAFGCSAGLRVLRPGQLRARLVYAGKTVFRYSRRLSRGLQHQWIYEDAAKTPLPGGLWGCEFSFGAMRVAATFKSGGPRGAIVGAAVCDAAHSFGYRNHSVELCASDESAKPLPAIDEIRCSALSVWPTRRAQIRLLQGGENVAFTRAGSIKYPLSIWSGAFAAEKTSRLDPATGNFAPGTYTCRFSISGQPVVDKPFRIGAR